MARIKVSDLAKDRELTCEEMKQAMGGTTVPLTMLDLRGAAAGLVTICRDDAGELRHLLKYGIKPANE